MIRTLFFRVSLWCVVVCMATVQILLSCSSGDEPEGYVPGELINFSTTIDTDIPVTRAYETYWESNDAVGIFMTTTDYATTWGKANAKHIATQQADLSWKLMAVSGEELYYPIGGASAKFIAYHPYSADVTSLATPYPVSLGVQSSTKSFDMLYYRKTAETFAKGDPAVLAFNHQLSKIVVNVKRSTEVLDCDISTMTITLKGTPKTANLNLSTGVMSGQATVTDVSTVVLTTTADWERTHQAIIIPHAGQGTTPAFAGRTLVFAYKDQYGFATEFTYTIPNDKTFASGKAHTYNFTITGTQVVFESATIAAWDTTEDPVTGIVS